MHWSTYGASSHRRSCVSPFLSKDDGPPSLVCKWYESSSSDDEVPPLARRRYASSSSEADSDADELVAELLADAMRTTFVITDSDPAVKWFWRNVDVTSLLNDDSDSCHIDAID